MNEDPKDARQALQRLDAEVPIRMQDPLMVLERAVAAGASMEVVGKMMEVRRELMAEAARISYFDALAAFQSECPIIIKTRAGHENRYNYAPLEVIVREVTPFLTRHGFSHQEDGIVTDGWVEAVVSVTHRDGHKEEKRFKVPAGSNAGMSPQQKYGAAMTYATRYAFCAAFGIRTADRDTDGPPGGEGPEVKIGLKSLLWNLLKDKGKVQAGQGWKEGRQVLVDEMCLDPDRPIDNLSSAEWRSVLAEARKKL